MTLTVVAAPACWVWSAVRSRLPSIAGQCSERLKSDKMSENATNAKESYMKNNSTDEDDTEWFETKAVGVFTIWQMIFICLACLSGCVIILCCCVRFRVPRTKQEIEADYMRRKITRKFQKQLRRIQNADMDEMDLKTALDRIRAEFKSDTESLAQSEAFSGGASLASSVCNSPRGNRPNSYRRASDLGISIEDLIERRNSGFGAKISTFVGRIRPRRPSQVLLSEEEKSGGHPTGAKKKFCV